jgi:gamma-tubulin complex component 3
MSSPGDRIDKALIQLVERQFVPDPNEDDASADERFDNLLDAARDILDRQADPSVAADVNHASDLIKKKCTISLKCTQRMRPVSLANVEV